MAGVEQQQQQEGVHEADSLDFILAHAPRPRLEDPTFTTTNNTGGRGAGAGGEGLWLKNVIQVVLAIYIAILGPGCE